MTSRLHPSIVVDAADGLRHRGGSIPRLRDAATEAESFDAPAVVELVEAVGDDEVRDAGFDRRFALLKHRRATSLIDLWCLLFA